jgi:hypothetical protein
VHPQLLCILFLEIRILLPALGGFRGCPRKPESEVVDGKDNGDRKEYDPDPEGRRARRFTVLHKRMEWISDGFVDFDEISDRKQVD